jgi:hypothetical protein
VALVVVLGAVLSQLTGAASATLPKRLTMQAFCQAEAELYASPAQLGAMWPDVSKVPTTTQAQEMVTRLYAMDYEQFGAWSIYAPTKSLKSQIYALNLASQKQFQEATYFNPGFNTSHTRAAEAGYTTLIERSAATIKAFLAANASTLVGDCRGFNDTRTVAGVAVMTTNIAQTMLRDSDTRTQKVAILKRAASRSGHYVVFVSLSVHGSSATAHYRVAAITGMVNACTTVPNSLPPTPVSVPC